ncbi:MAG: SRPBCC family protein [SAR202 cluster bacterium]|nr:SRPBCC family protein [SAR202 cluster bacterium]
MPTTQVSINAPPEKVFPALSDLTRHAKWSIHNIEIKQLSGNGNVVGSEYSSGHAGKKGDIVKITKVDPNKTFAFRSAMPNKMEIDHTFNIRPEGTGTRVVHHMKMTKVPGAMILATPLLKLMIGMAAPGQDRKFLHNMKVEMEKR